MKKTLLILCSSLIINCASPLYKFIEPKERLNSAIVNVSKELGYLVDTSKHGMDTIKVEKYYSMGYVTTIDLGDSLGVKFDIKSVGMNKQIINGVFYSCIKQELDWGDNKKYEHKRKNKIPFLFKNIVSPTWGTFYTFNDNPFIPNSGKKFIIYDAIFLESISIITIAYGIGSGESSQVWNGLILAGFARLLTTTNLVYIGIHNKFVNIKYDFNQINVDF